MPTISFTGNLKRFFPDLTSHKSSANTIGKILAELDIQHKGIQDYIVDEQGRLRTHVNIFVGDELLDVKDILDFKVADNAEVYVMQALSGG